jgi:hypothetical protein
MGLKGCPHVLQGGWMKIKIFLIILACTFGLIIAGAIIMGTLESQGTLTSESMGPQGSAAIQIIYFILFCVMCLALIPIFIHTFIVLQIKIGNGPLSIIQWLQAHERAVVYGAWIAFIIGLCLSLPGAIRDGFFN